MWVNKMKKYTIKELSLMSGLTTRTIRNYLKLGLLKGSKENNKWIFNEDDTIEFFKNSYVKQSIEIKNLSLVLESFNNAKEEVCNIIKIKDTLYENNIISIYNQINSYDNFSFKMHKENEIVKMVFSSNIETSLHFLSFINQLTL